MDCRVAVHLARRCEQEARALPLRETERVVGPVRADLQRLERQAEIVDWARGTRQMEDQVDGLVDLEVTCQIVIEEFEGLTAKMLDVVQ
jgi:hypothetical protein